MTNFSMKWTKMADGCYQLNGTSYEAVKDEHVDGVRWLVFRNGVSVLGIASEPSREFAGYAIQALIAEESR